MPAWRAVVVLLCLGACGRDTPPDPGALPPPAPASPEAIAGPAHPPADSLAAHALALAEAVAYDSARVSFEQAAQAYATAEAWARAVHCYNKMGEMAWRGGAYEQAKEDLNQALALGRRHLTGPHREKADTYLHTGIVQDILGDAGAALAQYDQALETYSATIGADHADVAYVHHNVGIVYEQQGEYDRAQENYDQAIAIYLRTLGAQHIRTASSYANIGVLHYRKGDYDRALDYWFNALHVFQEILGPQHPLVASSHNNIGSAYKDKGDYARSLHHLDEALALKKELFGEDHFEVATTLTNLGVTHYAQGRYARARALYSEALIIYRRLLGEQHLLVATNLYNIGGTHESEADYDEALVYLNRSLRIYQDLLGAEHGDVADAYRAIAGVYSKKGAYDQALQYLQRALRANVPGFEARDIYATPPIDGALSDQYLLPTLAEKAEVLAARARERADPLADLEAAHGLHHQAVQLVDQIRHGYQAEGSKLLLADYATGIYETAVQTALRLHRATEDESRLHDAFYFAEKSKAGVLLDALQETQARRFGGLPDALVQQEGQLRLDLAFYERSLIEERLAGPDADSARLALWQEKTFGLRQRYQALLERFESDYPEYYDLKYRTETASVDDLQQHLLDERTALVSYFTGRDSLYIFTLTADDLAVTAVAHHTQLDAQVQAFRQAVAAQDYDRHTALAHTLYQTLLAPVRDRLTADHLILVPDGVLCYLPFEALLTAPPPEGGLKDYRTLPYLLQDVAVSYAYSATLLLRTAQRRRPPARRDFIAFAPVFGEGPGAGGRGASRREAAAAPDTAWVPRAGQRPLPASREEVLSIRTLFRRQYDFFTRHVSGRANATAYLEAAAREARLKDPRMAHYRFVHLATHGFSSEEAPELSRLLLVPEDTTAAEDGVLYLGEVYTLSLNAELVVLSACETGLGKLARGEGLIGLTRGFLYAGADNVMVSLWQVPDAATRDVMVAFYQELLADVPRAEALRRAKLDRLQGRADAAAPAYWAPFVMIGR